MKPVKLRIVGHELVTISTKLENGTREETKLLKVSLRGLDGNKRTKMSLFVDEAMIEEFPLGDGASVSMDIKQLELANLDPASPPRAPRGNGRARATEN